MQHADSARIALIDRRMQNLLIVSLFVVLMFAGLSEIRADNLSSWDKPASLSGTTGLALSPYVKYRRRLYAIVGRSWRMRLREQVVGIPRSSTSIMVWLNADGKVVGTKTVSSTGSDSISAVGIEAIEGCILPPLPPVDHLGILEV